MEKRYYVDTSIWRDLHENRKDRFRPLGEWAFEFFRIVEERNEKILYSDFVMLELRRKYSEKEAAQVINFVGKNNFLLKVEISTQQIKEAKALCRKRQVAFGDALHAILARDNGAVMVTRDKHFFELTDIAEIRKPEELI